MGLVATIAEQLNRFRARYNRRVASSIRGGIASPRRSPSRTLDLHF